MLPQSFGHVNQKGMPAYFKEMLSKDKDEQIRLANDMVNEMGKTPEERDPDTQRRIEDMMQAVKDVKLTPPSQLSPQLQEVQRFMLTTESQRVQGDDKTGLPALLEEERQQHKKMIDCALMTCPPLRDLQHQINALLLNDSEERSFDIPAFREALHKHFGRNKEFLMIDAFTLTETCLLCQLIDLHMRKPEIHKKLIPLLCQAALFEQPNHPKHCSCMLCAHIRDPNSLDGLDMEEVERA